MTPIDRALSKAYSQRSSARDSADAPASPEVARGWVARLRSPGTASASAAPLGAAPHCAEPLNAAPGVSAPPSAGATAAGDAHPFANEAAGDSQNVSLADSPRRLERVESVPAADTAASLTAPVRVDSSHALPSLPETCAPIVVAPDWKWPAICGRLIESAAGPGLRELQHSLRRLAESGTKTIAFTGPGRGAGRTSLVLTVARLCAAEPVPLNILLVDFDFGNPELAQQLGIIPSVDFWQTACGRESHGASVVVLARGSLSLAPLCDPVAPAELTSERILEIRNQMRAWRDQFDLIVVDAGPGDVPGAPLAFDEPMFEAAIGVARDRGTGGELFDVGAFGRARVDLVGTIETFAPLSAGLEWPLVG